MMKSMKNIAKFIAAGSVLFALAACSHVAKFTTEDFVAVSGTSYTVVESTTTLTIPVCAYPTSGQSNTTVTFDVKNGTAVAGEDFTFAPANGVLNFAGEETQNITITIIGQPGVFTGDKSFVVELKDASNNYSLNNYTKTKVTIKDEDHPLVKMFGTYKTESCTGYWGDDYSGHEITLSAYEGDITCLSISNLDPYMGSNGFTGPVKGQLNEDHTLITIAAGQPTGAKTTAGDDIVYLGFDAPNPNDSTSSEDDIYIVIQEDGSLYIANAWGSASPSGWYEILLGGVTYNKK